MHRQTCSAVWWRLSWSASDCVHSILVQTLALRCTLHAATDGMATARRVLLLCNCRLPKVD